MCAVSPDRDRLAKLWQQILQFSDKREDLFGHYIDRLLDRHEFDRLPHPGFVGREYKKGGLLFLGMNPGAGGDGLTPDEIPHYTRLQQLQSAYPDDRAVIFESLIEYDTRWYPSIRIMRTIVSPLLAAARLSYSDIAYLNVLKWRTNDGAGLIPLYRISLRAHTLDQLALIDPGTIALLGVGVAKSLSRLSEFQERYGDRCVTIPRSRGDYILPPKGHEAINNIARRYRLKSQPTASEASGTLHNRTRYSRLRLLARGQLPTTLSCHLTIVMQSDHLWPT